MLTPGGISFPASSTTLMTTDAMGNLEFSSTTVPRMVCALSVVARNTAAISTAEMIQTWRNLLERNAGFVMDQKIIGVARGGTDGLAGPGRTRHSTR
ncbi:MAG: hypothetical protein H7Z40_18885 [Phycisphaerae bacterium]|nr:hypothetical protein [Gemmatimonadaceae bacterium]